MPLIDIEKVLRRLYSDEVQFVIIGGVATALHGLAHSTYDLDICYRQSTQNVERLVKALSGWHPKLRGVTEEVPFTFHVRTIRAGLNFTLTTDIGDVDLFGEVVGIGIYSDVKRQSVRMKIYGLPCEVLSVEGIIKTKKAIRRKKDQTILVELEALLELKKKQETGRQ
jgi:predicted nucleotidyltransferase